jgi:two-component system NtrC family sensor kinase
MRRRTKPAKAKVQAKPPVARKSLKNEVSKVRDLEKSLAESLERERAKDRALVEALEQQTATAEILRVISSSPTDIQPVFAAVVASAGRLCDAFDATIFQTDGERLRVAVHNGPIASHPVGEGPSLTRETPSGRAVLERRTIHVGDTQAEIDEYPEGSEHARRLGFRTVLAVPLMRESVAIGVINLRRSEARLFTERQVAMLQTFADQAIIAIENVRLFNETKEALEQQTATSEILRVISQSPTDVQPVFDAIAERAMRLCGASVSGVLRFDGELVHIVALANVNPDGAAALRSAFPMPPSSRSASARAILMREIVHLPDMFDDPEYGIATLSQPAGFRSILSVPMLREGDAIGGITVGRP